jgi:hypothetical protein
VGFIDCISPSSQERPKMKAFRYNNDIYIRVIPAKSLFNSTLIHETVNRGDIFAVRVSDSKLTIIPGRADVDHLQDVFPEIRQPLQQKMFELKNYD